jgi:hypothetical protein
MILHQVLGYCISMEIACFSGNLYPPWRDLVPLTFFYEISTGGAGSCEVFGSRAGSLLLEALVRRLELEGSYPSRPVRQDV